MTHKNNSTNLRMIVCTKDLTMRSIFSMIWGIRKTPNSHRRSLCPDSVFKRSGAVAKSEGRPTRVACSVALKQVIVPNQLIAVRGSVIVIFRHCTLEKSVIDIIDWLKISDNIGSWENSGFIEGQLCKSHFFCKHLRY